MENVTTVAPSDVELIKDKNAYDYSTPVVDNKTTVITTSDSMVNPTSTSRAFVTASTTPMDAVDNDITAVNITGHLDSKVDIAHVWALWGVVIAAGLLVFIILLVLSFRCLAFLRRPNPKDGRKPGRRIPRFRRGTLKLPARPGGVMADHKSVRKNFFHSLERGDVQARRQEATRRWLSGNLSTSLQFIEGSGSGGQQSHECIPMCETSHRHTCLDRIPENREVQQEYSFVRSPRDHDKPKVQHPILHRHPNDNANEFVRVIPLNVVRDQNANIALSPTDVDHERHHHYPRSRWNTAVRPVARSRVFPHSVRAVSSAPARYPTSRRRYLDSRYPEHRGHGRMRHEMGQRLRHTVPKLPKFNLAGEAIISSSEPSGNGCPVGAEYPSIWDDLSFDNTVFEPATTPPTRLVVPTNSPETDDSSSQSQDSLIGVSAGVSQCNVSSDASLTVTVGTSKRTSYEWDFYDPGYTNQPIRFVNGAYVPVIGCKQYWV
ncbi:uncharacterized protein LOC121424362 [Lytechinus variegatus]|uniref:uncharacterized protein LOC121424362 n=1 Tax=Lytechinus variegatus TaxID=7654 RepID=UPI001BB1CC13|nr:uncharacterized protein LOC121424362 [Lytechinus variegatus]